MYVSSNIETIFEASKKSKDSFIIRECVLSKLGEMLAKDKVDLIKSLRDRQLQVSKTGDNFILSLMLEQMKRSDDYCETLAKMLLRKDGTIDSNIKKYSRELLKTFKDIANSDNSKKIILEYKEQVMYGDDEAKKLYADAEQNDEQNISEKLAKRKKRIVIASIALGTIVIGGVIYYFIRRRKKKNEMSLNDDEMDGKHTEDKIEVEGVKNNNGNGNESESEGDEVDGGEDFNEEE